LVCGYYLVKKEVARICVQSAFAFNPKGIRSGGPARGWFFRSLISGCHEAALSSCVSFRNSGPETSSFVA
jgi:hypothetical protein